jgi:hypothetical protein
MKLSGLGWMAGLSEFRMLCWRVPGVVCAVSHLPVARDVKRSIVEFNGAEPLDERSGLHVRLLLESGGRRYLCIANTPRCPGGQWSRLASPLQQGKFALRGESPP